MDTMSPELINGTSEQSLSTTSSQGNSSIALISLVLVKMLRLALFSDGVGPKKNSGDFSKERFASIHGTSDSLGYMETRDGNTGPLVFGGDTENWNGKSLPFSITESVLNKYCLHRKTVENKMETEKITTEINHSRQKRRAAHRMPMAKPNTKNQNNNNNQGDSGSGLSFSLQVAIQIRNISIEIPFITWNI